MLRDRGGSERGSVAITVALSLTLLLAFAALVVDVGLNWAARTSAQTAADSAALAGASTLLLDGPAAAFETVETFLSNNQVSVPAAAGWADDGVVSNGEVVCWTMPNDPPDPPPGPGLNCPDGSNALQVITPPINVQYAFAPILGRASNSIKATAAAGAGPAAPNNCVLCLLEPSAERALEVVGTGGIDIPTGGIVVNSDNLLAMVLTSSNNVTADQIRVIGGFQDLGLGAFIPPAEEGGPPVPDPLANLPTANNLPTPPALRSTTPIVVTANRTLQPGIYSTITVQNNATLTLQAGTYVFRGSNGLTIEDNARVVSAGGGATIYLACSGYPTPCSGSGARFLMRENGRYQASPPTTGAYAGLSIFADPGNTTTMRLQSSRDLTLPGALYGVSTPVRLENSTGDLTVNSLMVVDSLRVPFGTVSVNYNPSVLLPGVGGPVLIR
jgi:Putative Flp pilus-assembly TadE/G-like